MVVLELVQMAVKWGFTETPVTNPALVVEGNVEETQGRVWGTVKMPNTVLTVNERAIRIVRDNAIKQPEFAVAVLTGDTDTCVTRPVVLVVTQVVTDTMEAVRANQAGKARYVVVTMLLSSIHPRL